MREVLVLSRGSDIPSSRGRIGRFSLFRPLVAWRRLFVARGTTFSFGSELSVSRTYDSIWVSRRLFRGWAKSDVFEVLSHLRKTTNRLVWLDASDSSGNTHFEFAAHVDVYAKRHLLSDPSAYFAGSQTKPGHQLYFDGLLSVPPLRLHHLTCCAWMTSRKFDSFGLSLISRRHSPFLDVRGWDGSCGKPQGFGANVRVPHKFQSLALSSVMIVSNHSLPYADSPSNTWLAGVA